MAANRVRFSQPTKDLLWSESGGHCQNPSCRADLHGLVENTHVGELAHIIPASPDGPRAAEDPNLSEDDRAVADNVLVLCPTCHTMIDKAPGQYPSELLWEWKQRGKDARALAHGTPVLATRAAARALVQELLDANYAVFRLYGPVDDLFDDARADQWRRHLRETIIPNNQRLLRLLSANRALLTTDERSTADEFAVHVKELEDRHLRGDWTPGSTRFPSRMATILKDDE
ncbi:HNH endonuclease [Lentzea kentuckyensis]|uniref:HNH endonuclease n=1 Tax=Lentzea kentuckyensis TaxID=360086 RepID=UPI001FE36BE6|nr:HNH endonuclease [Lentzea kentuckyensis]